MGQSKSGRPLGLWSLGLTSDTLRLVSREPENELFPNAFARFLNDGSLLVAWDLADPFSGKDALTAYVVKDGSVSESRHFEGEYTPIAWNTKARQLTYQRAKDLWRLDWSSDKSSRLSQIEVTPRCVGQVGLQGDWSPDGKSLFLVDGTRIFLIQPGLKNPVQIAEGARARLAPSGKDLAFIAKQSKVIQVLNLQAKTFTELYQAGNPDYYLQSLVWSPDSACLAAIEEQDTGPKGSGPIVLKIFELATGKLIYQKDWELYNLRLLQDWR